VPLNVEIVEQDGDVLIPLDHDKSIRLQSTPFRIEYYLEGKTIMTLNEDDTLWFTKSTQFNSEKCKQGNGYAEKIDYNMAVGVGALFQSQTLYGLPER
jgi:hypothetical protein